MRIVFLDAADAELVRRYDSTRRRHPLGDGSGRGARRHRSASGALLEPVKAEADVVIDTTDLNVHQLKARLVDLFGAESPAAGMQTTVESFGYKHGLPLDVDIVIDCRFLPNPHWVERLRAADRPRRAGARLRARPGRPPGRSSTASTTCSTCCCRPTRPRARAT